MSSPCSTGVLPQVREGSKAHRRCGVFLDALVAPSASMTFACVGGAEGRMAAASRTAKDAARAASIAAQLALGESLARQALRDRCAHSTIVTHDGVVVSVLIPSERGHYALSVGADAVQMTARVLLHALDAAERLARILDYAA